MFPPTEQASTALRKQLVTPIMNCALLHDWTLLAWLVSSVANRGHWSTRLVMILHKMLAQPPPAWGEQAPGRKLYSGLRLINLCPMTKVWDVFSNRVLLSGSEWQPTSVADACIVFGTSLTWHWNFNLIT